MGYAIVSGNNPSSVALQQNNALVFIEMLKYMPKFYSTSQNAKTKQECWQIKNITVSMIDRT